MIRSSGAYLGGRSGIYPVGGGSNTDPDAQAVIDQMTSNGSTPSAGRQTLINQLVLDLKGIGNTGSDDIWSLLDILNIHAAEDAIQAQTQWINADGTYDSVQVGTPTFTADLGFSSTTVSNRIDPVWVPTTALGNYTLNNASVGFYGVVVNAGYFLADSSVGNIIMRGSTGFNYEAAINSAFIANSGDWGSLDNLFILDRNSSANFNKYTGTTLIQTNVKTSTSLTSNQIRYPYAFSGGGTQTAKIVFFGASVRGSLTQLKDSFDAYLAGL